jgi:hypothetical protein
MSPAGKVRLERQLQGLITRRESLPRTRLNLLFCPPTLTLSGQPIIFPFNPYKRDV